MEDFVLIPLSFYQHLISNQPECNRREKINVGDDTTIEKPSVHLLQDKATKSHSQGGSQVKDTSSASYDANPSGITWLQNIAKKDKNKGDQVIEALSSLPIDAKSGVSAKNLPSRKTRIQGVLDLIINCQEITFNTSTASFSISSNSGSTLDTSTPGDSTASTTFDILTFLRDLQIYQKKVPESYFSVLNLLFPPTSQLSVPNAKKFIVNRNCLNYILNRNVHEQRDRDPQ